MDRLKIGFIDRLKVWFIHMLVSMGVIGILIYIKTLNLFMSRNVVPCLEA